MSDEDVWSVPCHTALLRDRPTVLAIDSETSGLTWKDTAFGVSFAWEVADTSYHGESEDSDTVLRSGYIDIRYHPELWAEVREWIIESKPKLLTWNGKFDFHKLRIYPQNFEDGTLMVYLLNEHYPKALKVLAREVLKEETDEDAVLRQTRKELNLKVSDGYDQLPLKVVAPYAEQDSIYTYRLCIRLDEQIKKVPTVEEVYVLEKQLLLCVAGTEIKGMRIDQEYVKAQIIELGDQIIQLEREIQGIVGKPLGDGKKKDRVEVGKFKSGKPKFKMVARDEFNPNSPIQILEFLNKAGVQVSNTDKVSLEAVGHPLAKTLTELRRVAKLRSTYLIPILEEAVDLVLHPSFNLTATKTKRFSSSAERG